MWIATRQRGRESLLKSLGQAAIMGSSDVGGLSLLLREQWLSLMVGISPEVLFLGPSIENIDADSDE